MQDQLFDDPAQVARAKAATPAAGSAKTGNRMAPHGVRDKDLYETPAECTRALLSVEALPDLIWEPACGPGAMIRELRAAGHACFGSDLGDYGSPDQDAALCDFRKVRALPLIDGVPAQAIVTNPPYKIADAFVTHALGFGVPVYMLLRTLFMAGANKRRRAANQTGRLARVHLIAPRPLPMHRDGWEGNKLDDSMQDYAWYVWLPDHQGPPTLHWVNPRPFRDGEGA